MYVILYFLNLRYLPTLQLLEENAYCSTRNASRIEFFALFFSFQGQRTPVVEITDLHQNLDFKNCYLPI